jgi:hypothetical protein
MKRIAIFTGFFICFVVISTTSGNTQLTPSVIDTVKPTSNDIPDGFVYGKVPQVYKKTLKDNPWVMDNAAIKRLAGKIYPGGDSSKIAAMHVSIMARKNKPFGDDIVCYVILYKDAKAARDEIRKVAEFTDYNSDRCVLLVKENLAVFLFVDDVNNFHYIRDMAAVLKERLNNI